MPRGRPRKIKEEENIDVSQEVSRETPQEEEYIDDELPEEEETITEDPKAHLKKELSELENVYELMKSRGIHSISDIEVKISQVRVQLK